MGENPFSKGFPPKNYPFPLSQPEQKARGVSAAAAAVVVAAVVIAAAAAREQENEQDHQKDKAPAVVTIEARITHKRTSP